MNDTQLIDYFQRMRSSTELAIIEGVQALKHAARFKATFEHIICSDHEKLTALLHELAPDVESGILAQAITVSAQTFAKLSPQPPRTGVIAAARRVNYTHTDIDPQRPIVFLENPRDLENIGAVIRVAAAAEAAAVVVSGTVDVWHPAIIRGAAGLHYALPVLNAALEQMHGDRALISLDPTGELAPAVQLPKQAVYIFGTERHGITQKTLEKSDQIIRLPMRTGVSSLNLATSVAATLYMM